MCYIDETKHKAKSRSSRLEVFCKNDVLKNFAKFTGKHLRQSLNFNKVAGLAQVFSCELCKISKNTFSWWNKHNNLTKSSERSRQLPSNINYCFEWAVISNAPKMLTSEGTYKHHILPFGKVILTKKKKKLWKTSFV